MALTPEYSHLAWKMAIPHVLEPYVRRALLAVLDLHRPGGPDADECAGCDGRYYWPCDTVTAIMDAMHEPEGAHTHDEDGNAIPS